MLKIGLRTIKTAIAVYLCLMFYILLKLFELIPGVPDNFAFSWYNPFFAGIACAYSVHASKNASIRQAKNRCVASLIGGITGIILISLYELCGGSWPNLIAIDLKSFNFLLPYLLIGLCTIIVIMVGVSLKQQAAVFVSILTFLSVTVNPNINVGIWQWQFGTNRILSTIIGVLIALGVNLFRIPHRHKNKNLLFCVGIDGMLLSDNDKFKGFINYKMNYLNSIGANVTLFTTRTPTTFMPLLEDVNINHPVVCMSGAALYDAKNCKYLGLENIDVTTSNAILKILHANNISPFINIIQDDVLFTYNESLDNAGELEYANSKKNASYCCFIKGQAPKTDVLYFLMVEEESRVNFVIDLLKKSDFADKISILVYDIFDTNQSKNLKYVKIYSKNIEELNLLKNYCNNDLSIVGLTSSNLSNHLLKNSRYSITTQTNDLLVKQQCQKIVKDKDSLFKEINKLYYANLSKYGK